MRIYLSAAVVLLASLSILATWAEPFENGDLFISLAGGRDVVNGKLAQPDEWSFVTNGRVWINQNWLSHLLIYLAWCAAGEGGLLALKATLIAALTVFLWLLAIRRGCQWQAALLLSSGLTASCYHFTFLRANLFTLVMAGLLLWLLHRSMDTRGRIWWVLPVMLVWSNLHGGYVFGLGMVCLWAACISIGDAWRLRQNPLPKDWPLWACAAACVAEATVSPFGLHNLTHPLVIAGSQAWHTSTNGCRCCPVR